MFFCKDTLFICFAGATRFVNELLIDRLFILRNLQLPATKQLATAS